MRILYFTEGDSPHDRRFLSALAGSRHETFALRMRAAHPDTPSGVTELTWPGERPDWAGWPGWEAGANQLEKLLAEVKPDLVHAGPVQGPAFLAAHAGWHPLVTMSWGSDLLRWADRSPWMRCATRFTLDRTEVFLGDCQTVADAAAGYGVPREKMVVFPWGVDLDHFSPENGRDAGLVLRRSLGWEDEFVILCNRTWAPVYGVDVLAEAFVKAASTNSHLRLLLVGDGPEAETVHRILDPVADRVHFPGRIGRAELPGYYQAANLFVSPSYSDGSSVSLMEALACGRPVLVSDIPSNREWVRPGENGDCFPDGDVVALAGKIRELASNPDLSKYGENARQLALRRADWERNFSRLLEAYQLAVD
ncbi:glycosyltransferase [bacterium]|nr:glycosyltransferase [bacterium]